MRLTITTLILIGFLFGPGQVYAEDYKTIANEYIQEKIKITGSVDVYDENLDKVRNLRLIKWQDVQELEEGRVVLKADFRDINNGDLLAVAVMIVDSSVENIKVSAIKSKKAQPSEKELNKVFTQEEIQNFITGYITQKSEYTKTFDIFDQREEKFLKLQFDRFASEMRTFGILYIQTTVFQEVQTNQEISFDITVEHVAGELKIQKIKRKQ